MQTNNRLNTAHGVVLSDLHLFARRSQGMARIKSVRSQLASARVLVLNGDIFDFRWSTLSDLRTTATAAVDWLRDLLNAFPQCQVHYVLGNHDCLRLFREKLSALVATQPRLYCHEHGVRLSTSLFLHGDCTDEKMDPAGLREYRELWENDRQRGELATKAYIAVDRLGITRLTIKGYFPRRRTVNRITHYLDHAWPDWRYTIRDCYFGHTHVPFSDYQHDGVRFHNTGSAIRGLAFNPIVFPMRAGCAETLRTSSRNALVG